MPLNRRDDAPTHQLPGAEFTTLATPSCGSPHVAVWEVRLEAGHDATPHQLTRHEVFVALEGAAVATLDGVPHPLAPGDCLVVPPWTTLALQPGDEGFTAVCCLPSDGQGVIDGGDPFTPPWAL